jgi:hypothetical protein
MLYHKGVLMTQSFLLLRQGLTWRVMWKENRQLLIHGR